MLFFLKNKQTNKILLPFFYIISSHFYMITFINQIDLPLVRLLKYQLDMPMISQLACHFFDIPR